MDTPLPAEQAKPRSKARPKARLWELWAAIGVITIGIGGVVSFLLPATSGDRVPSDVDAKRAAVFSTMQPIPILVAPDEEEKRLAETMRLPPPEKESLLAVVAAERSVAPSP